jgi:hypothetical protein
MRKRDLNAAPSRRELKRLFGIASLDGLGWFIGLHESLEELRQQVEDGRGRLDELGDVLAGTVKLTRRERRKVANHLRRLIAFNNTVALEEEAIGSVGFSDRVLWDAGVPLEVAEAALSVIKKSGRARKQDS